MRVYKQITFFFFKSKCLKIFFLDRKIDFLRGEPIFGLKNREPEPGRTGTGRKGGRDHQMTVSCDPDVASETSHDTKRKSGLSMIEGRPMDGSVTDDRQPNKHRQ